MRFEKDAFPHLDALCGTALWLTCSRGQAADLVLRTMIQAYRTWSGSGSPHDSKMRLFSVLARECSGFRFQEATPDPPNHVRCTTAPNHGDGDRPTSVSPVECAGLPRLKRISDEIVSEAISRFDPRSRLIMVLLLRERYSYSTIADITGLSRDVVRSTLGMLRHRILHYQLGQLVAAADDDSTVATDNWDNEGGALACRHQG